MKYHRTITMELKLFQVTLIRVGSLLIVFTSFKTHSIQFLLNLRSNLNSRLITSFLIVLSKATKQAIYILNL